jgi:hypothetical protein
MHNVIEVNIHIEKHGCSMSAALIMKQKKCILGLYKSSQVRKPRFSPVRLGNTLELVLFLLNGGNEAMIVDKDIFDLP